MLPLPQLVVSKLLPRRQGQAFTFVLNQGSNLQKDQITLIQLTSKIRIVETPSYKLKMAKKAIKK
jgi:hypothetical protein